MDITGVVVRVVKAELKKPNQARVYLNEENQLMLDKLAENQPDLEKSKITTILLSAALPAAKQNDYRLPMPLRFLICKDDSPPMEPHKYRQSASTAIVLNEPSKKR